ncbi:MAG: hypothetical protein IJR55_03705 [Clostridia bacterium]|nr:hypothetical protein [Clostridia bacterium]
MADHFGAIASNEIKFTREKLFPHLPQDDNGVRFKLKDGGEHLAVPKKMSTKAELDKEIERLKMFYAPYMKNNRRGVSLRNRIDFTAFLFREATKDDEGNLPGVLAGDGDWREVKIPHYAGPLGRKETYYRVEFDYGGTEDGKAAYLHFDGVDYIADVFVNGNYVGSHEGFFAPFEFDVTTALKKGKNTLLVVCKNDFPYGGNNAPEYGDLRLEGNKMYAATGPGYDDPHIGWHHCPPGMGIYQGVYLETRGRLFISDIFVRPMPLEDEFEVWCEIFNTDVLPCDDVKLVFDVFGNNFDENLIDGYEYTPITYREVDDGRVIDADNIHTGKEERKLGFYQGANLIRIKFKRENMRLWQLDSPYLYSVGIKLICDGKTVDVAERTFGMREFHMGEENGKKGMFFLNGKSIRLRGANTMGYEQQDVICGDGDALLYDMLMAKACNMNFLRITQRPVQREIYELCDRIGLMIQTDLPLFTNIRRTKFAEVIRQAEEMERLIRPYACTVLSTYINEPFPNANGKPHRHFVREETERLFEACDSAVRLLNPDRVIKHIDGDYDPPSTDLPDYHTYTMWYNGHGIDMGRVYRGYWLDTPKDWYCGCGEYGAEGLDGVELMRRRYPKEWLPQNEDEEKRWTPSQIPDAQSGNMFYFFYDRQDTLEKWVDASREHQVVGTKLQTEAFRRNADMVTFAIHLFIDAFPSGWMKTIVDCEREPKAAFFAYRDALTPLMVGLRTDRKTVFAGEKAEIEAWICNDTHEISRGHMLRFEVADADGNVIYFGEYPAVFGENSSFLQGKIAFGAPEVKERKKIVVRAILLDSDRRVIHFNDEQIEVFEREKINDGSAVFVSGEEYLDRKAELDEFVKNGGTLIVEGLKAGEYEIAGSIVKVKNCGMRPLHFVSRKTGHTLVEGFEAKDFRFWFGDEADMITPIIYRTFVCLDMTPILLSGNSLSGSAWGKPLFEAFACAEKSYGKGKIVVSEIDLSSHLKNPVAVKFRNRLANFI